MTYRLRDKKPKNLVDTKEMVIEIKTNLNVSHIKMFNFPRAKVETKKSKSKDQVEETLVTVLKKINKIFDDMNVRDWMYMNKFNALEKGKRSTFLSNNKSFVKKHNEEGKQAQPNVPNTLTPTNVVNQVDSSSNEYQSDSSSEESEYEEASEKMNVFNESQSSNILLGDTYTRPRTSEVKLKEK